RVCDRLFETRCNVTKVFLFFFQAEDGIRDFHVTGVQTCALPISQAYRSLRNSSPTPRPSTPGQSTYHGYVKIGNLAAPFTPHYRHGRKTNARNRALHRRSWGWRFWGGVCSAWQSLGESNPSFQVENLTS